MAKRAYVRRRWAERWATRSGERALPCCKGRVRAVRDWPTRLADACASLRPCNAAGFRQWCEMQSTNLSMAGAVKASAQTCGLFEKEQKLLVMRRPGRYGTVVRLGQTASYGHCAIYMRIMMIQIGFAAGVSSKHVPNCVSNALNSPCRSRAPEMGDRRGLTNICAAQFTIRFTAYAACSGSRSRDRGDNKRKVGFCVASRVMCHGTFFPGQSEPFTQEGQQKSEQIRAGMGCCDAVNGKISSSH